MSLESEISSALRDERLRLTPPPGAQEAILHGVARRRRRRRAAGGAAVLTVLALAVPAALWMSGAPADEPAPAGAGEVVPWLDQPAAAPTAYPTRDPRPEAEACDPRRLGAAGDGLLTSGPGVDGVTTYTLRLTNLSPVRCTVTRKLQLNGAVKVTSLPDRPGPDRQYPATVDPGETANVDIAALSDCAPPKGRRVAVIVDGRKVVLPATVCDVRLGSWYVRPPLPSAPPTVTLTAPGQVRRGATLAYTVKITNTGLGGLGAGCPSYGQGFEGRYAFYRLNCDGGDIPAHTTRAYAMRLQIPVDAVAGRFKLTWMLVLPDGRSTVAATVVTVTP